MAQIRRPLQWAEEENVMGINAIGFGPTSPHWFDVNVPPTKEKPSGQGVCPHYDLIAEAAKYAGEESGIMEYPEFCGCLIEEMETTAIQMACQRVLVSLRRSIVDAINQVDRPLSVKDGKISIRTRCKSSNIYDKLEEYLTRAKGFHVFEYWRGRDSSFSELSDKEVLDQVVQVFYRLGKIVGDDSTESYLTEKMRDRFGELDRDICPQSPREGECPLAKFEQIARLKLALSAADDASAKIKGSPERAQEIQNELVGLLNIDTNMSSTVDKRRALVAELSHQPEWSPELVEKWCRDNSSRHID